MLNLNSGFVSSPAAHSGVSDLECQLRAVLVQIKASTGSVVVRNDDHAGNPAAVTAKQIATIRTLAAAITAGRNETLTADKRIFADDGLTALSKSEIDEQYDGLTPGCFVRFQLSDPAVMPKAPIGVALTDECHMAREIIAAARQRSLVIAMAKGTPQATIEAHTRRAVLLHNLIEDFIAPIDGLPSDVPTAPADTDVFASVTPEIAAAIAAADKASIKATVKA